MLTAALSLSATGCLKHTRLIERPQQPPIVLTSGAEQVIEGLDERFDAIHTMKATVMIRASVGGESKGKITDYTSIRGYILLRQPGMLRVLGLLPVVETRAFDMVSNGKNFKLLIPPKNQAVVGTGQVTRPSSNPLMNLRPAVFFDSLLIQKINPDDLVYMTTNTRVIRKPDSKHLTAEPDYDLGILRRKGNSQQLVPVRVIHISRTNLLPSQLDEYDSNGTLITKTTYDKYEKFENISFPTHILIDRPVDGYQLDLTILKLTFNQPLADDQFELKIPPGTKVKQLP